MIVILQATLYPWGRSLTGAATLPGKWVGEGVTPSGQKIGAYLTMRALIWGEGEGCQRGCDLDGVLRVCTAGGIRDYMYEGDVQEHHGRYFMIDVNKTRDRPYGYRFREVHGQWPGGDTMRIAGVFEIDRSTWSTSEKGVWVDARGERHKMTDAEQLDTTRPTYFTMRRGRESDFNTYCAGIR
ncbi:MAG: hypothetical protein M3041_13905 [Acidobacteriota bacterium]|nr:hypothetical protein [Acidobacteriota bacterium]